jgi:hypothetical protein
MKKRLKSNHEVTMRLTKQSEKKRRVVRIRLREREATEENPANDEKPFMADDKSPNMPAMPRRKTREICVRCR